MSDIQVIDNLISAEDHQRLKDAVVDTIPWSYGPIFKEETLEVFPFLDDLKYNMFFCHMFYRNFHSLSDHFRLIDPILSALDVGGLLRAKMNLYPVTDRIVKHCLHVDNHHTLSGLMTAIYFVNTNDGYAFFETGEKVDSVENRIVIFPNTLKHSGTTCTNQSSRVVLNLNFF